MRYIRQIVLKEIGKKGQEILRKKTISIVGVGGLGSVSAELLVRSGIGRIILIDHDSIEITNLQRQSLYSEKDIGERKVFAAKKRLSEINNEVEIIAQDTILTNKNIDIIHSDLVLDCTDNMATRYLINNYCSKHKIPWIHASAIRTIGNIKVFIPEKECFECIYQNNKEVESCEENGILNMTVFGISSIQAIQAIKLLIGVSFEKKLLRLDVWNNTITKISVKKRKNCDNCNGNFFFLKEKKDDFIIKYCSNKGCYETNNNVLLDIKKISKKFKLIKDGGIIKKILVEGQIITVYETGKLVFQDLKNTDKIKEIARKIYKVGMILK
ncbi:MAG: HesA/MoeB/ThiF family protein [Candidatus Woesearchaeota archaeon]